MYNTCYDIAFRESERNQTERFVRSFKSLLSFFFFFCIKKKILSEVRKSLERFRNARVTRIPPPFPPCYTLLKGWGGRKEYTEGGIDSSDYKFARGGIRFVF